MAFYAIRHKSSYEFERQGVSPSEPHVSAAKNPSS